MSKTMPTECEHGKIVDWGDFDGDDNPYPPQECTECKHPIATDAVAAEIRNADYKARATDIEFAEVAINAYLQHLEPSGKAVVDVNILGAAGLPVYGGGLLNGHQHMAVTSTAVPNCPSCNAIVSFLNQLQRRGKVIVDRDQYNHDIIDAEKWRGYSASIDPLTGNNPRRVLQ